MSHYNTTVSGIQFISKKESRIGVHHNKRNNSGGYFPETTSRKLFMVALRRGNFHGERMEVIDIVNSSPHSYLISKILAIWSPEITAVKVLLLKILDKVCAVINK